MDAEFINVFGGNVVLKNARGKTSKVPPEQLSAEDMKYVRIALKRIAEETVARIFMVDLLAGVNMKKVIDVYEVAGHHCAEI